MIEMYLLDENIVSGIWAANIVTGGIILAVLVWLLQRFIKSYDDRLMKVEEESKEIKENYIKRFDEVHKKIDASSFEIRKHFDREIRQVIKDRHENEVEAAKQLSKIETKLDNLIRNINHD